MSSFRKATPLASLCYGVQRDVFEDDAEMMQELWKMDKLADKYLKLIRMAVKWVE